MATFKTPKFQTKIHLPELPGSFTFRKNGKLRLDQQVKKFCLLNKCRGCFEVKVHFGYHTNVNKINYDAKDDGVYIDTLNDQQKYKLFVPYPKGVQISIPKDPEAQFFCGKLSAKLAIVKYDLKQLPTNKKKKIENLKAKQIDNDDEKQKMDKLSLIKKKQKKNEERKNKRKQKRVESKRKRKLSLDNLNKIIAKNNGNDNNENEPPQKKRKLNMKQRQNKKNKKVQKKRKHLNPNEMSINDQHEINDGVVSKIENIEKEKKQKAMQKDSDIKEYLENRAERKKQKQAKKEEIRKKFMERKWAKKKALKMEQKSMRTTSKRKVTFNL